MTTTHRRVSRRTVRSYSVLYASGAKMRPIVVTILPGDVLEFREHGRRERFLLAIDTAFKFAVRCHAFSQMVEKKKAGKLKPKKKK